MLRAALLSALVLAALPAAAQPFKATKQPDVRYVPSPDSVVDAMLELAHVTAGDIVYDLGSGDGVSTNALVIKPSMSTVWIWPYCLLSVLGALSVVDDDLASVEVQILDPQTQAFHQAQTGAIEQTCHQSRYPGQFHQDPADLLAT